jgi:hypothetical protein
MLFPNLVWAIRASGLTNYRAAGRIGMSESRFSRALRGLIKFKTEEKSQLAGMVGQPVDWLFAEIHPPTTPESHCVLLRVLARDGAPKREGPGGVA